MSLKLDLDEFLKVVEANSRRFDNLTRTSQGDMLFSLRVREVNDSHLTEIVKACQKDRPGRT